VERRKTKAENQEGAVGGLRKRKGDDPSLVPQGDLEEEPGSFQKGGGGKSWSEGKEGPWGGQVVVQFAKVDKPAPRGCSPSQKAC